MPYIIDEDIIDEFLQLPSTPRDYSNLARSINTAAVGLQYSRAFASIVTFDCHDSWIGDTLIEVVAETQDLLANYGVSSEQLILPSYFNTQIQKQEYRNILAQAEWIKQCLAWSAWYANDRRALFILSIRTGVRGDTSDPASLWLT